MLTETHELYHPEIEEIEHNGVIWRHNIDWYEDARRCWFPVQELVSAEEIKIIQFGRRVAEQEDLQRLVELDFIPNEKPFWDGEGKHIVPWDSVSLKAKYDELKG